MDSDVEIIYTLPFGPDIVIDGSGRCITPKPEPYFRVPKKIPDLIDEAVKEEQHSTTISEITSSSFSKLKKYDRSDIYTSCVIFITTCFIGAFLAGGFGNDIYGNHFTPDSIPDYALESAGAQIFREPESTPYLNQFVKLKNNLLLWKLPGERKGPESILQPWRSPGECWAFAGQQASVQIRLSHTIVPRAVTVEHISKSLSPTGNIASAPRQFSIFAVDEKVPKEHLGSFEYQGNGAPIQTFSLFPKSKIRYPVRIIEVQFHSNHGNFKYTCVYKIRVHGDIYA